MSLLSMAWLLLTSGSGSKGLASQAVLAEPPHRDVEAALASGKHAMLALGRRGDEDWQRAVMADMSAMQNVDDLRLYRVGWKVPLGVQAEAAIDLIMVSEVHVGFSVGQPQWGWPFSPFAALGPPARGLLPSIVLMVSRPGMVVNRNRPANRNFWAGH